MWWKDPNWLVQAAVAIATFSVAFVALFGDVYYNAPYDLLQELNADDART